MDLPKRLNGLRRPTHWRTLDRQPRLDAWVCMSSSIHYGDLDPGPKLLPDSAAVLHVHVSAALLRPEISSLTFCVSSPSSQNGPDRTGIHRSRRPHRFLTTIIDSGSTETSCEARKGPFRTIAP